MIKSKVFISVIIVESCILLMCLLYGYVIPDSGRTMVLQGKKQLVTQLHLTDLAIWTEARYTRHPSQTDFFSAFQDFPGSPEHFPAGSIIAPSILQAGQLP